MENFKEIEDIMNKHFSEYKSSVMNREKERIEENDIEALFCLFSMYDGLLCDFAEKSDELAKKLADLGHPPSIYNMGVINEKGFIVPRNLEKAEKYYKKALKKGITEAAAKLNELKKMK